MKGRASETMPGPMPPTMPMPSKPRPSRQAVDVAGTFKLILWIVAIALGVVVLGNNGLIERFLGF